MISCPYRRFILGARLFLTILGIACVSLMLLRAPPALAHAALISTSPMDGAVLAKSPAQAELVFDEPVSPLVFTLIAPGGKTVALKRARQDNDRVAIDLPPLAGSGTFGLSWRVVSADGHPVGGTFVFSVGAPSSAAVVRQQPQRVRDAAIWLGRALLYAALFFGAGASLFRAWARRAPVASRRPVVAILLLGVVLVPVTVVLQGLDALDAPFSSWSHLAIWRAAFSTSYGISAILTAGALGIALVSLAAGGKLARGLAVAGLLLAGLALAATGHASTASPFWLARSAVWLHAVAIACWLGSLVPLWRMLGRPQPRADENLRWFSRWIVAVVVLLVGSGTVLAFLQFDRVSSLWLTAYGRIFMAKMMLVAVLFGFAAYNRYRLTAGVVGGNVSAAAAMRRVIAAEISVALCILAVVALWRFTPPPRIIARAESIQPVFFHLHTPQAMAEITIAPAHGRQPAAMAISLMANDGKALRPRQVTVYFSNAAAGVQPVRRTARKMPDGVWRIDRLDLPPLGVWTVRIDALVSDFDRISLEKQIRLNF